MTAGGFTRTSLETEAIYADHLARYRFAAQHVRGKNVLDFGCGDGYGSLILKAAGATSVTGIDIDPQAIQRANLRGKGIPGVKFVCLADSVKESVGRNESFDTIVFLEVLEHIPQHERLSVLSELRRCLGVGGVLLISTPNWEVTQKFAAAIDTPLNPYHCGELTLDELEGLLEHAGFRCVSHFGLHPVNATTFERGTRLSKKFVARPTELTLGNRILKLPLFARRQIFRASVMVQWIGSGGRPIRAQDWEVRPIEARAAETANPTHLLLIATSR